MISKSLNRFLSSAVLDTTLTANAARAEESRLGQFMRLDKLQPRTPPTSFLI
jgi:hypothetical protein